MRVMLLILLLAGTWSQAAVLPGFEVADEFLEQSRSEITADGVRLYINAPKDFDPHKTEELIIYLLPNGNTIEQTLGRRMTPGMDWHFDIQHIAAHGKARAKTGQHRKRRALLHGSSRTFLAEISRGSSR